MQRRRKLEQYLSYLSAPPLPCCCSSLWSPERRRQGVGGRRDREEQTATRTGLNVGEASCGWTCLDALLMWTHRRPDGQTTPSQEHKPARTPVSERQRASNRRLAGPTSLQGLCWFLQENTEKLNGWSFSFLQTESRIN